MKGIQKKGKVIFVGAGPGDPELLTLKAAKYLKKAEVILTDRLVSDQILQEYANDSAEILYVGKQCRKGNSTSQETINELMCYYAGSGKLVVRLKGGDVSIFSNILDELNTLVNNNIPYEIIPGITAAIGAAAYTGIPLTARNYSTAIRFLTYYKSDIVNDSYWRELANTEDTLVFYMSVETLDLVVAKLISNNISSEKKMAVVEQATTPNQKIYTCGLYEYEYELKKQNFISPSLVIIGKVVSLHEKFAWIKESLQHHEYFNKTEDNYSTVKKTIRA